MRLPALCAALLMFVGSNALAPAMAQSSPPVSNPNGVLPNVSLMQIKPVLDEAGLQNEFVSLNNIRILKVTLGGYSVVLSENACDDNGACAGLWMFATLPDGAPLETINAFNRQSKPARAILFDDRVVLDHYLIADYGVSRGTLIVSISVFTSMIEKWQNFQREHTVP